MSHARRNARTIRERCDTLVAYDPEGVKIVLTAPRGEMSSYSGDPFSAFIAVFPEKVIPRPILRLEWFRPNDNPDGSAKFVPYGLRKVEALLLDAGIPREDVVCCHPDNLERFVGPKTTVVGITSMDPMGLAYVSVTYNSMIAVPGESVDAREFRRIMENPVFRKYDPVVIVGGAGAWQVRHAGMVERWGVDVLLHGEGELIVADLFKRALAGETLEKEVHGSKVPIEFIPTIKGAASYGVVEITRGCGRGCQFCSPTNRRRHSLPLDHIMKEVEVNVRAGATEIFLATEDIFLYECGPRFEPNPEALETLFTAIARHPGVDYVHLSHLAIAPVAYDPRCVERISPILLEKTRYTPKFRPNYKEPFVTALFGIESGSIRIMKKYMRGKIWPYPIEQYHEVNVQGVGILNDNRWKPMATLITGWPDETPDDTVETLELLDKLKGHDLFLVPLLFVPLEDTKLRNERRVSLEQLTPEQWDVFATSWRMNIDVWDPRKQPLFTFAALFAYFTYFRWKHGTKVFAPIMKIANFPVPTLPPKFPLKADGGIDPRYCREDPQAIARVHPLPMLPENATHQAVPPTR
ncbi:MAG: B12-binding domain-containing radical SAM protein [Euryarchaeota archaeon]|nr:B12-binding domain-containing radical SAM protein [Euryarchaeota archaeon]